MGWSCVMGVFRTRDSVAHYLSAISPSEYDEMSTEEIIEDAVQNGPYVVHEKYLED